MVQICIEDYRTGWNCSILRISEGYRFDAHADSSLVLKCLRAGLLRVRSLAAFGARKGATFEISIRGETILSPVAQEADLAVDVDDEITLKCHCANKGQAWYFWEVVGVELVVEKRKVYHCSFSAHLGDAVAILVALENYAIKNRIDVLRLVQQPVFRAVYDAFQFKHVQLVDAGGRSYDIEAALRRASWQEPWIRRFGIALSQIYGGEFPRQIQLPPAINVGDGDKEDIVLCQFDNRSSWRIPIEDLRKLLSVLVGRKRIALIGGPDTKRYFGDAFEYRLGNLRYIVEQLLHCRFFIGSDSGIGHVAGILGVDALIINSGTEIEFVQHFFREYRSVTVFDRRLIKFFEGADSMK